MNGGLAHEALLRSAGRDSPAMRGMVLRIDISITPWPLWSRSVDGIVVQTVDQKATGNFFDQWSLIANIFDECDQGNMSSRDSQPIELEAFMKPVVGLPAWGAKQGYGSFLTFEFGQPELKVEEWHSDKRGLQRNAYVQGERHVWIYCCLWKFSSNSQQVAWSEDGRDEISRASSMINGQKLLSVSLGPATGVSRFEFDLGGCLETWPAGEDQTDEQWFIYGPDGVFAYRADGKFSQSAMDTPHDQVRWLPSI